MHTGVDTKCSNWPCVVSFYMHGYVTAWVHTPATVWSTSSSTDELQLHHKHSHLQAKPSNVLPYQIPDWLSASFHKHKLSSVYEAPLSVNTVSPRYCSRRGPEVLEKSLIGQKCFVDVTNSCHTDLNVFQKHNYFLGESSDLWRVKAVIRGANRCFMNLNKANTIRHVRLRSNQSVLSHYTNLCLSTISKRTDQSSKVLSHRRWRLAGVGSETRGTWGLKKRLSQMSSCELIRFSITVFSNHTERREMMKGVMNTGGNLGRKGWRRSTMCVRLCGMQWTREGASGCFPTLKLFHCKSCWCASPGKSTHDMFVFMWSCC